MPFTALSSALSSYLNVVLLALVPFAAIFSYLFVKYQCKQDPREPPYLRHAIPFVGNLIGLIRWGAKWYSLVNDRFGYPIFTLPMLNGRCYVVCDATLAGLVQRNARTMSFYSLIVEVTRRLIAFDAEATRITFHNMNKDKGPGGLMERVHEMMNNHLAPGPGLDSVASIQMTGMAEMLNSEVPANGRPISTDLYAWQRHIFGVCNMRAIYGPENIFVTNPETEQAFWDFEDGMLGLVVDVMPHLTARKAFYARRKVLDALVDFVKTKRYRTASPLIQERVNTNLEFRMSEEMSGHAELILIFGILGNAVPSNFWLIANIFSRPELLQRIREEVQNAVGLQHPPRLSSTESRIRRCAVDSKTVSRSCPLLYSCYRETLRSISLLTSARLVLEDTLLAGKYLLRKGSVVQIAGGVIHLSSKVWGHDAESFNAERFLVENSDEKQPSAVPLPSGVPSAAFRAFGGGTVICPGRHFAQSELMNFAAVLALGFDILDADGGPLRLPAKDDTRIPLSVMKPVNDPKVRIQRRQGWEGVEWEIRV